MLFYTTIMFENLTKLILLSLIVLSCNNQEKQKEDSEYQWELINIKNSKEELIIYKYEDTATYLKPIWKYISGGYIDAKYKKIGIQHKTVNFTKSEKDSLVEYVLKSIQNPINSQIFCTDYVGKISLTALNVNSKITVSYNSICEFDTLSPYLTKLYKLITSKIEFDNK